MINYFVSQGGTFDIKFAAEHNRLNDIKYYKNLGADINKIISLTMLQAAAVNGHMRILRYIVS